MRLWIPLLLFALGACKESDPAHENSPATSGKAPAERNWMAHITGSVAGEPPLDGTRIAVSWVGGEAHGVTDARGDYAILVPVAARAKTVRLRADARDGRVGFGEHQLANAQSRIKLRPAGDVSLRTINAAGTPIAAAIRFRDSDHNDVPVSATTGTDGRFGIRLPTGRYRVLASGPGLARAASELVVGEDASNLVLTLPVERPLLVRVRDAGTNRPVPGATVRTWEQVGKSKQASYGNDVAVADKDGNAHIAGLNPADKVALLATPPGQESPSFVPFGVSLAAPPADGDEMVVVLDAPRTIEFEVKPGDIAVPAAGTNFAIENGWNPKTSTPPLGIMENGKLIVRGCAPGDFSAFAHGPDGTAARLFCARGKTRAKPIAFTRACNLNLTLRYANGSPAPGLLVLVRDEGRDVGGAPGTTDENGHARWAGLSPGIHRIQVFEENWRDLIDEVGVVDWTPRTGDVAIVHTLASPRPVEFQFKLAGKPILRAGYRVKLAGVRITDEQIDPLTGTYQATAAVPRALRPGTNLTMTVSMPGCRTVEQTIPVPEDGAAIRHTFDLEPELQLLLREVGPLTGSGLRSLEHLSGGEWRQLDRSIGSRWHTGVPSEEGRRFVGLEPGRYRIKLSRPSVVLAETEVVEDGPNTLIADFTKLITVKGRVELPPGYRSDTVQIVHGDDTPMRWFRGEPGGLPAPSPKSGEFELNTVAGSVLSIRHPRLSPDPVHGRYEVKGSAEGVVLKLVEGPVIRFRTTEWDKVAKESTKSLVLGTRNARLALCTGDSLAEPVFSGQATAEMGTWEVGGMRPGTYTVFIEPAGGTPVVLRAMVVKDGINDLGELAIRPGGAVRVRVLVNEGFIPPRFHVELERLTAPPISRAWSPYKARVASFTRLPAGQYRVRGGPSMRDGVQLLDEIVEVTEDKESVVTLDLR